MTKVYIARGSPLAATQRVLEMSRFKELIKDKKKIVIKPNLVLARRPEEGITTDVRVVEAIIRNIPDDKEVFIIECSSEAEEALELNGYMDLEKKYGVKVIDGDTEFVEVNIDNYLALERIRVAKIVLECDFLISVAKLKVHSIAKITATLKNLMGLCPKPDRLKIHSYLPHGLIDLLSVRMPDFGVIDGIIANEIDENVPHPVEMGVVLAGRDCVALDHVASHLIGVQNVHYIRLAYLKGLGSIHNIEIIGIDIESVKRRLKTSSFNLRSMSQKVITKFLMKIKLFEWYNLKVLPIIIKFKKYGG